MSGKVVNRDIGRRRTRRCLRHNRIIVIRPLTLLGGAAIGFHANIVSGAACQARNSIRMAGDGNLRPGRSGVDPIGHCPLRLVAGRGPVNREASGSDGGNHNAGGLRTSNRRGEGIGERGYTRRIVNGIAEGFHIDAISSALRQVSERVRTLSILNHSPVGGRGTLVVEIPMGGITRFSPSDHC